jgi:3'-phosphoadenosine 5'-phosphosulfate synthase
VCSSVEQIVQVMQQKEILPWRQEEGIGELFVAREMVEEAMAEKMPGLVDLQWVQVLSEGPALLKGFIREKQFLQSQHFTCLLDSAVTNQSVPIVLAVTTMDKQRVEGNTDLVLRYRGVAKAVLRNVEFYEHRKEERCARQSGTTDPNHPYIKQFMANVDWLERGELELLERITWYDGLDQYRHTPKDLKQKFKELPRCQAMSGNSSVDVEVMFFISC